MEADSESHKEQSDPQATVSSVVIEVAEPTGAKGDSKGALTQQVNALEQRVKRNERFERVLTLVIAVAAVVSAVVAALQWHTMDRQLIEMRGDGEQTDKLIAQVSKQADAAIRLAMITDESLRENKRRFDAEQRPFLISNITPQAPKAGASLEARVSMINYGRTPALQVGSYAAVLIGPDALKQADHWFSDERQQKFDTSIGDIIPPGMPVGLNPEIPVFSNKKLTLDDIETLVAKDNQAVFVARHLYFDTAGNSFGTDTCYRLLKGWVTAYCKRHNEVHEDYKEQRYKVQNTRPVLSR